MLYRWEECRFAGPMAPGFDDRVMEGAYSTRASPPADVFCYPLVDIWKDQVWAILSDFVTEDIRTAFIGNPPEYVVSDDLSWLNQLIWNATGQDVEMKSILANRLRRNYRAFRAGHATRTNDLTPFYSDGLRRLNADEADIRARAMFLDGTYSWATADNLQAAIADVGARDVGGGRDGRLYFCADERELFSRSGRAGHYLVYGSEYLYCLGQRIIGTGDTQKALKSIGRPTMIVCDIPMTILSSYTLESFAGLILEYLFSALVPGMECHALSPGAGSALSLKVDLGPEHIIGHYHPREIHSSY